MNICQICGEPDAPPFRHSISANAAALIGSGACKQLVPSGGACGQATRVTCVLGVGHFVYMCPNGHTTKSIG